MKPKHIKTSQRILAVDDDGIWGPLTRRAAIAYADPRGRRPSMADLRWLALVIQTAANATPDFPHVVAMDAWWGPVTEDAAYRLAGPEHIGFRPDETGKLAKLDAPTIRCWSPRDAAMIRAYGNPGSNQEMISLPFPMRLDWDLTTTVQRTQCHRTVATSLQAALETIRDHYGLEEIRRLNIDRFGGVLNVRKKRGGSTWSAHAWGTAIDLWPGGNRLRWKKDRAEFAKPEYAALRAAFTSAGWMSLGTCYDFDWMHWQRNPA